MPDLTSVPRHSESIVTRKTGNEYVLVPVTDNIADMTSVFTLNETGAFIWDLIDGKRNIKEIIESISGEYDVDPLQAEKDVFDFINDMCRYLITD